MTKRDRSPMADSRNTGAPLAEDVFERLVESHADLVLRLSYTYLGNRPDAEDVTQTVFLKALVSTPLFNDAEHEKAWFIRVTANACKDALRARKRREVPLALDEAAFDPGSGSSLGGDLNSGDSSREAPGPVTEAVLALPPAYREVVFLYYYEEYSTRDIAALTGSSEVAVRARLSRARKKMRPALEGVCHG